MVNDDKITLNGKAAWEGCIEAANDGRCVVSAARHSWLRATMMACQARPGQWPSCTMTPPDTVNADTKPAWFACSASCNKKCVSSSLLAAHDHHGLAVLHLGARRHRQRRHQARTGRLDNVLHLHGFQNNQHFTGSHLLPL